MVLHGTVQTVIWLSYGHVTITSNICWGVCSRTLGINAAEGGRSVHCGKPCCGKGALPLERDVVEMNALDLVKVEHSGVLVPDSSLWNRVG